MNFYITTPIYYANAELHIGHGYTSVITDILKRFHSLAGEESFYLTGMDEHGAKVEEAALAQGKTPQQLCDENYEKFVKSLSVLGISYDYFIRTTSERHKQGVQKLLSVLWEAKTPDGQSVIYKGKYEGLYCTGCEKFITEKELTDDGLCPNHLTKPEKVVENNYFFRLTSYLDQVRELIESNRIKIMPEGRRNEVLGLLKQDLSDFSISRERLNWGIDLPFDPEQKTYVWVDALPNYITAIGYADNPDEFDKWWNRGQIVHLMAKDILKFHAIFWPAMLLAAGLKVPDIMFIHGYISINGQKISKSLGNVISNEHLVEQFGRDAARFLLTSQFPFHQDGDISYPRLYEKYNSDLANDYGNLVSRVTKMTLSNFHGKIPPVDPSALKPEDELHEVITRTPADVMKQVRDIDVLSAIDSIWNLIRAANRFFDYNKPWELAKQGETEKLAEVLYRSLEAVGVVATLTWPIMPQKSEQVFSMLGLPRDFQPQIATIQQAGFLKPGSKLNPGENIFPRLQPPKDEPKPAETKKSPADEDAAGLVTIDDFFRSKLKVAEVVECEPVPKADKLLRLQIKLGEEKRQIIAGIAQYYQPDQLIGKKIIVVSNLQPATIRGVESHGMLLAAKKGKELTLVTVDGDIPSGADVG